MKAKGLCAVTALVVVLGLMFQSCATSKGMSAKSKKEMTEKVSGLWQAVAMQAPYNDINKVAYTGMIKCYDADHSYHFFLAAGKIGFSHDGSWEILNDSVLLETCDYRAGVMAENPVKSEVKYHLVDDNTLIIVWRHQLLNVEMFDLYKRIGRDANPTALVHKQAGYALPMNDYVRSLMRKK